MEENTHILPGDQNQNKQRLLVFKFSAQLKTHHFRIINFLPQYLSECPRRGKIWRQNCFWRWGNKQFFVMVSLMEFLRTGAIFIWFDFCHAMGDTDFGDIRNDDWVQDHFKIKQLPVTSRQQPSEPNIREIPDWFPTRELSWARGFHDDSNLRTLLVCCTKSISLFISLGSPFPPSWWWCSWCSWCWTAWSWGCRGGTPSTPRTGCS